MYSKCLYFVILTMIVMFQGAACFFIKHVKTGMCISGTRIIEEEFSWGKLVFVGLSNACLDPVAQYRFYYVNNAIINLKSKKCFHATVRSGNGYNLPMLYTYLATNPPGTCHGEDYAVTQTSWGGLSIQYLNDDGTRCAVPKSDNRIKKQGVDPYIGLEDCNEAEDKRFDFGSLTCSGNATKNANCPKNQYMVVKTASYRRLSPLKTCGLSDDHNCEVNATCLVKKQCDGLHECNITVNDTFFSGDQCPGSTKYLYFEYQCINTATPFKDLCGGPRVLTNISSGDIRAKKGDLVNLLCSAQGELPITFSWEKDKRPLESFVEKEKPHRSSLLLVTVKDQASFGKYICHIRDRFQSTNHTISVQKYTEDGEKRPMIAAEDDEKLKWLFVIIALLAILLIISFAINAYLTYQNRRLKSSKACRENTESRERSNLNDNDENNPETIQDDANSEQVEDEQSTYTALNRNEEDENVDHIYAHLNKVNSDYVIPKETVF